jgi:hypothetical protein
LVVAVHHAAERREAAGHEDVGVLEKAAEAMFEVGVVLAYE